MKTEATNFNKNRKGFTWRKEFPKGVRGYPKCQRLFMSGYRLPLFSNPINKLNLFTCRATLGKKFRWVYYDVILFPPFLV